VLCTTEVKEFLSYPSQQDRITFGAESNYRHQRPPKVLGSHLLGRCRSKALQDPVCIRGGDAYNFKTFADGLRSKGGVPVVPKEREEVALCDRYKAMGTVKVGVQLLRVFHQKWREHYHIEGLQAVR
jgi:hypothetical protein